MSSDERVEVERKAMKKKIIGLALCLMLFAPCVFRRRRSSQRKSLG